MKLAALIPVKGFQNAKQRLAPLLTGAARELLAESMFRDVLREVRRARGISELFVVTANDRVAEIAAGAGVRVIREPAENGETAAVNLARTQLKNAGWQAVLIVPGDMPLVQASDIEELCTNVTAAHGAPFALLVPSHDRKGTNALLLAPPDIIELRFGYDSFTFHVEQVAGRGLPVRVIENEHIALDVDEPQDLERFLSYTEIDCASMRVARSLLADPQSHRRGVQTV
jgi:2-phospho-L-lactate guanylyltransferase